MSDDRNVWWFYQHDFDSPSGSTPAASGETPIAKILSDKTKWIPFKPEDRDRMEAKNGGDADIDNGDVGVMANGVHRLWKVNVAKRTIRPLYWRTAQMSSVRRTRWIAMGSDDDTAGGIPVPPEWDVVLEDSWNKNEAWIHEPPPPGSESGAAVVEKLVVLEGNVLGELVLVLRKGVPTTATLQPVSLLEVPAGKTGASAAAGSKALRLFRGYMAYYSAVVSALNLASSVGVGGGLVLPSPFDNSHEQRKEQAPQHLIFVVHGIGQKMADRLGHGIVGDVDVMRKQIVRIAVDRGMGDANSVHILPVQWRSQHDVGCFLHGPENAITGTQSFERALQSIALESVPVIRNFWADVSIDILLYMAPIHYQRIMEIVVSELRRIWLIFCRFNPGAQQSTKVSFVGHSLGSAIVSDLLSIAVNPHTASLSSIQTAMDKMQQDLGFGPLNAFFAIGSPLPLFLLLKHIKPAACMPEFDAKLVDDSLRLAFGEQNEQMASQAGDQNASKVPLDTSLPSLAFYFCRNFYNVFLPNDPIAYRMEPLIVPPDQQSFFQRPVLLPYGKKGVTKFKMDVEKRINRTTAELKETIHKIMPAWMWQKTPADPIKDSQAHSSTNPSIPSIPVVSGSPLDRLNWRGRVDYAGQESILENSYLSAISSHMEYWQDEDVLGFILGELFAT